MKFTKEYFDSMEKIYPKPEGMSRENYDRQVRVELAEYIGVDPCELDPPSDDHTNMTPRVDEPVPWDKRKREVMAAIRRNQTTHFHCDIAALLQEWDDKGVLYQELGKLPEKIRRKLERIRSKYKSNLVHGYKRDPLFSAMMEEGILEIIEEIDGEEYREIITLSEDVAPRTRKKYTRKSK